MSDFCAQEPLETLARSINIVSFRGLKEVNLEELDQVNLLVGGNNSGKTSVLEAIAVLHAGTDLQKWLAVALAREVRTAYFPSRAMSIFDVCSWMFPSNDQDLCDHTHAGKIDIKAEVGSVFCCVQASLKLIEGYCQERSKTADFEGLDEVEDLVFDTGIEIHISNKRSDKINPNIKRHLIWSKRVFRALGFQSDDGVSVEYIPPYSHRNSDRNLSAFSKVQRTDRMGELDNLMSKLDPRISGIEFASSGNRFRPIVAARLRDRSLVPVSVMGDGVRRGLSIALAILNAKCGVVLIDEIEAGFHVGAFSKVFDWILRAASGNNVQVFATSHSLEAIEAIARSNNNTKGLSAYLLGNDQGRVVKRFTAGMLRRLVVEAGMDIRL